MNGPRSCYTQALIFIACFSSAISSTFQVCSYGADGAWDLSAPLGEKWRVLGADPESTRCQPRPLLRQLLEYEKQRGAGKAGAEDGTAGGHIDGLFEWRSKPQPYYKKAAPLVLLLGDSAERYTGLDWCQRARERYPGTAAAAAGADGAAAQTGGAGTAGARSGTLLHLPRFPDLSGTPDAEEPTHRYLYFLVCEGAGLSVAVRFIPGVHPTGPYHKQSTLEGACCDAPGWPARTKETLQLFTQYFGRAPDLVLAHANYWDMARVPWSSRRGARWLASGLPTIWLDSWRANFTAWVTLLRKELPQETLVVARTAPPPAVDPETGIANSRQLGGKLPIAQVNAAMRVAARALGLPLVDCEASVAGLTGRQVLRDFHHPAPWATLEWLNLLLNQLAQHRPALFEHLGEGHATGKGG